MTAGMAGTGPTAGRECLLMACSTRIEPRLSGRPGEPAPGRIISAGGRASYACQALQLPHPPPSSCIEHRKEKNGSQKNHLQVG